MPTSRLEAFSDGVLAIIITIMVLELHRPDGDDWQALSASALSFVTYVLSFVYIGIYWSNHHHLFQLCERVDGVVLWANLHLLFWLSLYPFTTAWLDESHVALAPTVLYGLNLFAAGAAYYLLALSLMRMPEVGDRLRAVMRGGLKEQLSMVFYALGIGIAFIQPWLALIPYVIVALMWLVPDRRIERYLAEQRPTTS